MSGNKDNHPEAVVESDQGTPKPYQNVSETVKVIRSSLRSPCSTSSTPKRVTFLSDVVQADLQNKYMCLFPPEFFNFWEHVQMLAGKYCNPCGIFASLKSLRLCGVFDYLAGHLKDADSEKCLLHDRYATDLPEMQTLAVYSAGRFVYWRDNPNTEQPLIVRVDNSEHFPRCVIVGIVDPFYILAHLVGSTLLAKYKAFFSKDWIDRHQSMLAAVKGVVKSRKTKTFGAPFHGIGIQVDIVDDFGYRPLTEPPGKLKEMITIVATSNDEDLKMKKLQKIVDVLNNIESANDEKDFGMGLEMGHNLFWSNYQYFDGIAEKLLITAYKLLNREEFARILKMHMAVRRDVAAS